MTQLYNKVAERDKRRILRNNMPRAEAMLWARLRNCQVGGFKFRRQYSVGAFVIDFYCPKLKLAIEVDGASHRKDGIPEYDAERQLFLKAKGITGNRRKAPGFRHGDMSQGCVAKHSSQSDFLSTSHFLESDRFLL